MRFLIGRERLGQLDRSQGFRMSGFGLEEGFRHNQRLGQRRAVGQRLNQDRQYAAGQRSGRLPMCQGSQLGTQLGGRCRAAIESPAPSASWSETRPAGPRA